VVYRDILRPLIFALTRRDPEYAHMLSLALLAGVSRVPPLVGLLRRAWTIHDPALERTLFGVRFPNPVGLAAGYDKDGLALPALAALGFGHIEVGTVTWHVQPGNPRPRVFRLARSEALINRMGFNNAGAAALALRLKQLPPLPVPLGISLGKSKRTPLDAAVHDYRASLRLLYPYGDYFAVNVSSPNTPGLRALQDRAQLEHLLAALQHEARTLAGADTPPKPLLVKLAPDLDERAIAELLDVCSNHKISGIIATNTTIQRPPLPDMLNEAGGLSGRPLHNRAVDIVRFISHETGGHLPIIGVGGIFSPDDARRMLDAGASLLQVYTGFIYQGPRLVRAINLAIRGTHAYHKTHSTPT
jgi:dihydroorotate dehydrogenase